MKFNLDQYSFIVKPLNPENFKCRKRILKVRRRKEFKRKYKEKVAECIFYLYNTSPMCRKRIGNGKGARADVYKC